MTLPNYISKYNSPSIITPEQFLEYRIKKEGSPNFPTPKLAILCYSWDLLDYILKQHKTTKVKGFIADTYLLNETNNQVAVFSKFGIGAPAVTILIEELIAFGVKNFIAIGNAGGLQKNLKIGDIVLCEKALRDEGVSYHYIKSSQFAYPSKRLFKLIESSFKKTKTNYKTGSSWTHDVMYRETIDEIKYYQKKGILTVELEAASIFAVGKYRKVEILVILTVSDLLANFSWKPGWHRESNVRSLKNIFLAVLDVFKKLD